MYDITLTFTDGKVEKASSRDHPHIFEGTLRIIVDRGETRIIPLTSLREWTVRAR